MESDELKAAWKSLEKRLERDNAINLAALRDRRLDKARSTLRPLFWGQIAQMAFGLLFILLGAALWAKGTTIVPVIVAGVLVHAYGIAAIACAGQVLGTMSRIDYASPVVTIQKQLARVRRRYIISGMYAGLPWWFLWVPILMVLAGLVDVDLYARVPEMVWIGGGVGVAGLLGTWAFHRWSRSPERAHLASRLDASLAGASLRKAQAQIDEIVQFERE